MEKVQQDFAARLTGRYMEETTLELSPSGKIKHEDCKFSTDLSKASFVNRVFVRLVAKGVKFVDVDFRYSTFDAAYLRNCMFESCDFTGCRFVSSNLHGSNFQGCKFDYATFEKTDIDSEVLSSGCPGGENLRLRFARTLRVNYQQLGDAASANRAIEVELEATEAHLYKSWNSKESYYRSKYRSFARFRQYLRWTGFKALDVIWGNGESPLKLLRAVFSLLLLIAILDAFFYRNSALLSSYVESLHAAPMVFFGVDLPSEYPRWYLTIISVCRLILFGLFMAIIVKRLNRR